LNSDVNGNPASCQVRRFFVMSSDTTSDAVGFDQLYNAEDSSYLEKQVSRLQFLVATLLEKNELLRQRLVAAYEPQNAFTRPR
jgi:hypothetical protein